MTKIGQDPEVSLRSPPHRHSRHLAAACGPLISVGKPGNAKEMMFVLLESYDPKACK